MPLFLSHHGICSQCVSHIPKMNHSCFQCGLPNASSHSICYRCCEEKPWWDSLISVSDYSYPLKKMVHDFKFHHKIELIQSLARLMFLAWYQKRTKYNQNKPDLVTCVPLHFVRHWLRGFNQSELLANPISRWLRCDFKPNLLERKKIGIDQKNLALHQRQENVKDLFACLTNLDNQSVLLVDDIVTTGSTINAISKLLKEKGALHVYILCLCRTIL